MDIGLFQNIVFSIQKTQTTGWKMCWRGKGNTIPFLWSPRSSRLKAQPSMRSGGTRLQQYSLSLSQTHTMWLCALVCWIAFTYVLSKKSVHAYRNWLNQIHRNTYPVFVFNRFSRCSSFTNRLAIMWCLKGKNPKLKHSSIHSFSYL